MNIFRHGDISLNPVKEAKEGNKEKHNGSFVLAYGEATGHHHTITVPKLDDMDVIKTADGGMFLVLRAEGRLMHQEHKELIIPVGTYEVTRERECDHFAQSIIRKVVD